jgi:hypothetical protein
VVARLGAAEVKLVELARAWQRRHLAMVAPRARGA